MMRAAVGLGLLLVAVALGAAAETIDGRWKLVAAEDLRPDGTVARYPWGKQPVGSIVVAGGFCYLQIMSSDVPAFPPSPSATARQAPAGDRSVGDQMKAALTSTYIAYTGPCTVDQEKGSVTLKVEAAWRPDYVGTEQTRYFRFENGKMFFGPATGSIKTGGEALTRRLTLERVPE